VDPGTVETGIMVGKSSADEFLVVAHHKPSAVVVVKSSAAEPILAVDMPSAV
jgi:hypothetical protein